MSAKRLPLEGSGKKFHLEPITEKMQVFVDGVIAGLRPTVAARRAGFADPKGEVGRLMATRAVTDRIILGLQGSAVKLGLLVSKAYRALDKTLSAIIEGHERENCMLLDTTIPAADRVCTCHAGSVKAADGNTAARIVLDVAGRNAPSTIAENTEREDRAMSKKDAVDQALGDLGDEPAPADADPGAAQRAVADLSPDDGDDLARVH